MTIPPQPPAAGGSGPASGAKAAGAARSRPLVLVVDDFEDNRAMFAEFLRYSGFDVIEAADGAEAIDKATKSLPDIVVMDLSLPVLDGWEATRRIRHAPGTCHIPVVALTGHAVDDRSEEAREAGCDRFLTKPCLPEVLLDAVRGVLDEARLG